MEVSETTFPFGLLRLAEQFVPCSAPVNVLARLRPFANTVSTTPFKPQVGFKGKLARKLLEPLKRSMAANKTSMKLGTLSEQRRCNLVRQLGKGATKRDLQ
ncbi:hypothetical protein GW17_00054698 [Ensete ventricosum]|nr:hypothetical protein GW17_00054698 [Ensete ventricosum]